MTPVYSDDHPDEPNKHPVEEETKRYAVSMEVFLRLQNQDAYLVRKADMQRYIGEVEGLEAHSSNWVAAMWALIGIAASLAVAAATVPGQLAIFGGFALLCSLGAFGCFVADRQVNRRRRDAAAKIAREMSEGLVDILEIRPLRSEDDPPPPKPSA